MPPWYANPCWSGIELPITPLVTAAWVGVAALGVEALALLLGPLGLAALQRRASRGALMAALLLVVCAVGAALIANWMTLSNFVGCPAPFGHYVPALAAIARAREAALVARARVSLAVLALALLLGAWLTVMVYRRWPRPTPAA